MATLENSSSIEQSEGGGVRERLRMDVEGAKDAMVWLFLCWRVNETMPGSLR